MGKNISKSAIILPNSGAETQGFIQLPFNEDGFKEFLTGVLGKPQTINGNLSGTFNIEQQHINHLITVIEQRISQQNDAHLIQFNARIGFDDNSSVLLNSFQDFVSYNELRNIVSSEIHITLTYLIKFHDKNVPEKQEISLSFLTKSSRSRTTKIINATGLGRVDDEIGISTGVIQYEIKHTARTWATDISSLLSNGLEALLETESRSVKFLRANVLIISLILGNLTSFSAVLFILSYLNNEELIRINKIEKVFSQNKISFSDISRQIKYIAINNRVDGDQRSVLVFAGFIVSLFLTIFYSILIDTNQKKSFILLTQAAYKSKGISDEKYKNRSSLIVITISVNIILGIISSYIYDHLK